METMDSAINQPLLSPRVQAKAVQRSNLLLYILIAMMAVNIILVVGLAAAGASVLAKEKAAMAETVAKADKMMDEVNAVLNFDLFPTDVFGEFRRVAHVDYGQLAKNVAGWTHLSRQVYSGLIDWLNRGEQPEPNDPVLKVMKSIIDVSESVGSKYKPLQGPLPKRSSSSIISVLVGALEQLSSAASIPNSRAQDELASDMLQLSALLNNTLYVNATVYKDIGITLMPSVCYASAWISILAQSLTQWTGDANAVAAVAASNGYCGECVGKYGVCSSCSNDTTCAWCPTNGACWAKTEANECAVALTSTCCDAFGDCTECLQQKGCIYCGGASGFYNGACEFQASGQCSTNPTSVCCNTFTTQEICAGAPGNCVWCSQTNSCDFIGSGQAQQCSMI